jgi:hypothetical protein
MGGIVKTDLKKTMKNFLTLVVLFLIAGSMTALGYSFYRAGLIGVGPQASTAASSATSTFSETENPSEKDLSWMQQIRGVSEENEKNQVASSTEEERTSSTSAVEERAEGTLATSSTETGDTSSTTSDENPKEEDMRAQSITDLGKSDALSSTAYDYAFKSLVLSAELRHGTVFLTWTPATSETFIAYQVVRSTTDENPYSPKTSFIKTTSDVTQTAYTDAAVYAGKTYYYRVCMTKKGKHPACGNILRVDL